MKQLWTRLQERFASSVTHPLVLQNVVYFVGSLLVLVFAFLYQFLAGRFLGPAQYATVAAIFSLYSVLLVPGLMVTTLAMRQRALVAGSGHLAELGHALRLSTLRLLALSAGTGLVLVLLANTLGSFLHVPEISLLVLVPAVVLLLPVSLNRGVLQGEQRFLPSTAVQLIDAVARAVLVVLLITVGLGATGAILALSAGVALGYAASFWPLRHILFATAPATRDRRDRSPAFVLPTMVAVLGITLTYTVDVLLVKHFLPAVESGLYASASTLGRIIIMVTTSITTVMFPHVAIRHAGGERGHQVVVASALSIAGIAFVIVAMFALAPGIVLFPFGSAYVKARMYLPFFGATMAMVSLANLFVNYLIAIRDARFVPILFAANAAEIILIWNLHRDLWSVIAVVFGVATATSLSLGTLAVFGPRSPIP